MEHSTFPNSILLEAYLWESILGFRKKPVSFFQQLQKGIRTTLIIKNAECLKHARGTFKRSSSQEKIATGMAGIYLAAVTGHLDQ